MICSVSPDLLASSVTDQPPVQPGTGSLSLSISRKPLIAAKATGIDSFAVKSQLIDPLNNTVVLCTGAIMKPLLVNHIPLSYRAEKHHQNFSTQQMIGSVPIKSILLALFKCIEL